MAASANNYPLPLIPQYVGQAPAPAAEAGLAKRLSLANMLPRWASWLGHSHVYGPQPSPGSEAFAFEALGLFEFSPIGSGDHNRRQWNVVEGYTLFAGRALPTSGLGGLATGQVISQPLIVPQELLSEPLGYAFDDEPWIGG